MEQTKVNESLSMECTLCPRDCHADRLHGNFGYCGQSWEIKAARAALHMWEEPCISGESGSGTVFFSGCPLRCVFCQNHNIALGKAGATITKERLVEIFFELKEKGANNINLVTPTHFIPQIREALLLAKKQGLNIPIVYNTGSYECVKSLQMLEGIVDIYLPDFKYWGKDLAKKYSNAEDYRERASAAIAEMLRQTGAPVMDEATGLMKKGVIVRHLVLPGQVEDSKKILKYLYETYKDDIYISILNQFTPVGDMSSYPELTRTLTAEEYDEVVDYAIDLGVEYGFIQEQGTASESFIPEFDLEGI